jgi:heat shock protein HslJ
MKHEGRIASRVLALIVVLVGGAVISGSPAVAAESGSANPLAGTSWRLVSFTSMDDATGVTFPEDSSLYTMKLNEDGTVNMRLNCNRANGAWSIDPSADPSNGRFEFGPLATTKALCPPPSMDELIARQAQYIRGYLLEDGRLYLSLMADGGIFAWEPVHAGMASGVAYAAPEDGGPRDWVAAGEGNWLKLREQPSTTADVMTQLARGTVLDNLGCETGEAGTWCDVQPLGGGPRGWADAADLEPAVAPHGAVAAGPDDSALRAGRGDFDATGPIPCAQALGQPMTQCEMGVARAGGGYATVVVTKPDGTTRAIFFRMNQAIGADTSEADGFHEFSAARDGDLHLIQVGPERYEVPDAVTLGG